MSTPPQTPTEGGALGPATTGGTDVHRSSPASVRDDVSGMKTARTGGVVRAGAVMAVATLVSRATGFLAKVVIVSVLGFGFVNDAYTIANTLPNIVFELLIGGVLTSVAIPLLSRARADADGGARYTQALTTAAVVGLVAATALAVACAPLLTNLYLSGNSETVDQGLATALAYLLLPQIFFYGLAALFAAILNTGEKFGVPAWAPVANNLVVIGVGLALHLMPADPADVAAGELTGLTREQFLVLGLGTTFGIVVQALVMLPSLFRTGFRFRWRWGGDRRLLEAGGLMLWAVGYVLISQVGYIVTTNVASDNVAGGISIYAFASMLFQLPYGIIGVSILTAIMPRMSRHAAAGEIENVKADASLANRLTIVSLTPVVAGIVVLSTAVAVVTSLYGQVDLDEVLVLGATLAALIFGLVPFAVTLVQMRVFYAMKDARTPTLINAVMVAVRVPLLVACGGLEPRWVVPGLALATAISYLVGAVAGEIWLRARYGPMHSGRTLLTLLKMTVAGAAGAAAALAVTRWWLADPVDDLGGALAQIAVGATVGLLVVALVATLLKVEELLPARRRLGALFGRRRPPGPPNGGVGPATADPTDLPTETAPAIAGAGATAAAVRASPFGAAGATGAPRPAVPPTTTGASGPDRPLAHGTLAPSGPPPFGGPDVPVPSHGVVPGPSPKEQVFTPVAQEPSGTVAADDASPPRLDPAPGAGDAAGPASLDPATSPATKTATGTVTELHPGAMVGGRYRLVSLVAADPAGHRFWRAKDTVLPRDMAVTLLPDTTGTSASVARTLRAGKLYHAGLPQTLDVGTDHGQSYVVGQWVDGATLTELLSGGPLEPDIATSITAKVSEAVAEAHRDGIALGAISPNLVRVNFDGQVRLSHVIALASATPDHDIRAIGALLYLMLTGTWPLPTAVDTGRIGPDGRPVLLPPAPTRLGRELPADQVRRDVPEALSALAERALHPEEPDGIHAVGAIAALLRSPETVGGGAAPAPAPVQRQLSAADRRLIKERRVKLAVAGAVLGVFALLIVIALAGLGNQWLASIQNSAPEDNLLIDEQPTTAPDQPAGGNPTTTARPTSSAPSTAATAAAVKIVGGSVFDPQGDGNPDYAAYVDRAYDGNPDSDWLTWVYKRQFPSLKNGVGLMLELERETTPSSVVITSSTKDTVIEVRSAPSATASIDQTKLIATATTGDGPTTVELEDAPKSKYLLLFVTKMSPTPDGQFQSSINEVVVNGT